MAQSSVAAARPSDAVREHLVELHARPPTGPRSRLARRPRRRRGTARRTSLQRRRPGRVQAWQEHARQRGRRARAAADGHPAPDSSHHRGASRGARGFVVRDSNRRRGRASLLRARRAGHRVRPRRQRQRPHGHGRAPRRAAGAWRTDRRHPGHRLDPRPQHHQTERYLGRVDVALFVLAADQPLNAPERESSPPWRSPARGCCSRSTRSTRSSPTTALMRHFVTDALARRCSAPTLTSSPSALAPAKACPPYGQSLDGLRRLRARRRPCAFQWHARREHGLHRRPRRQAAERRLRLPLDELQERARELETRSPSSSTHTKTRATCSRAESSACSRPASTGSPVSPRIAAAHWKTSSAPWPPRTRMSSRVEAGRWASGIAADLIDPDS